MKLFLIGALVLSLIMAIVICKSKKSIIKVILGTILCTIVFAVSVYLIIPIFKNINYGLDLQGGFEVLYQIEPLEGEELTSDMTYNTYKAILKRIDILGVSEPEISIEDDNKIRIALAGIENKDEAREVIGKAAVLSFRDSNDNLLMTSEVLGGSAKLVSDKYGRPAVSLPIKDTQKFYEVTSMVKDMTNNIIVIWLDYDDGDSYFNERDNCGSLSASKCLSAARVESAFSSDVIIQGSFTTEEAETLVELINSGSLPTKLTEISSRTVEATYGTSALNKTMMAGAIGLILVIITLVIVYHFSGYIAGVLLTLYTMLSFLVFYLIEGTLTLPGIAAMLLGIGMAVDSAIITFERIKDRIKMGKNLGEATIEGNKEALSSIIDANVTTIIVAIILFIFGQSSVKGFATMLIISITLTVIVMIFLAKLIVLLFVKTGFFDDKTNFFIGLNKKKIVPSKEVHIPFKKINFLKISRIMLPVVLLVIVGGLMYTVIKKPNFAVDFTGGTSITVNTTSEINLDNYTIIKRNKEKDSTNIVIKEILNKDEIKQLTSRLEDEYKCSSNIYVVSDMVKKQLIKNALIALAIATIGIIIYVSLRFKFTYALAGIIALLHDTIITIIFFGLLQIEIDSIFIAAILTVIGYSINDTIVTFDMIRQSYRKKKKKGIEDLPNLVEDAVRLTFFRSLLTTFTTLLPVLSLIIFGSNEIFAFNLAILIGLIAGLFSSIFVSNSIWLFLEKQSLKRPEREKKETNEEEEVQIKGINC